MMYYAITVFAPAYAFISSGRFDTAGRPGSLTPGRGH